MPVRIGHVWRLAGGAVLVLAVILLAAARGHAGPGPPDAVAEDGRHSAPLGERDNGTVRVPQLLAPPSRSNHLYHVHLPVMMQSFWQPWWEDCSDLLANGDFQSGELAPWEAEGSAGLGVGRGNDYGGWLGAGPNTVGELRQWVTVPAGADPVRWEFWWMAEVTSLQPSDFLHIIIEHGGSGEQSELLTLRADRALNGWRWEAVYLSGYAGERIRIRFRATNDFIHPTTFRVDDVSVLACQKP